MSNHMPVWREVFLEVALRAIKRVHLSHTPWQLKKINVDKHDLRLLNEGEGIFLAMETTVAAEISNEFIYSSFTNGMYISDNNADPAPIHAKPRYYEILREISFKKELKIGEKKHEKIFYKQIEDEEENCIEGEEVDASMSKKVPKMQVSNKVDLVTRRWEINPEKNSRINLQPSMIELKRYHLYDFDLSKDTLPTKGKCNADEIVRDIENLKILRKNWEYIQNKQKIEFERSEGKVPFLYVLVWGKFSKDENDLSDFLSAIKDHAHEKDIHLKWLPLSFDKAEAYLPPVIKTWLWVALIEIDPPTT